MSTAVEDASTRGLVAHLADQHAPARLRRAADLLGRYPFRLWHYGDSIGFEGIEAASELLAEPARRSWLHGALRGWAGAAVPRRERDDTLAGKVLCQIAGESGDPVLVSAALDHADWLLSRRRVGDVPISLERAPLRRPYGGGSLPASDVALLRDPGAVVVVDSLHFGPPFLAALGRLAGRSDLLDAAAAQARGLLALLQDDDGLVWHFWLERTGRRYGYGWGRGQGWALLGLADVLVELPHDHAGRAPLLAAYRTLAERLRRHQRADGGFAMVVCDEDELEMSTAAFTAAGFARGVANGWLEPGFADAAELAWAATWRAVDGRGVLRGVSAELHASTCSSHYRFTPTGFVVPWGQGALLVAAREIARLRSAAAPVSG